MRNLIASIVVAFAAMFVSMTMAHAAGPDARSCAVGVQAPAYQDATLKAVDMTWTCDSQASTGGFNFKALGSSKPLQFQGCTIRWMGLGGTYSCKITATGYAATTVNGKPAVILTTNKGQLLVQKGFLGQSIKKL